MSGLPIVRLVEWCARRAWVVIGLMAGLTLLSAYYTASHFAIETDIKALFPRDLAWTQRAFRYLDAFPEQGVLVVVDAPTPELADDATNRLSAALAADKTHFSAVEAVQTGPFFERNGLLYMPAGQLAGMGGRIGQGAPLIGTLNADPSLRGALEALNYGLMGVVNGAYSLDALAGPMNTAADTVDDVLAGRPAHFSWQALTAAKPPDAGELRRFITLRPVLDYTALEPGRAASDAVTAIVRQLDLAGNDQARVRLTGVVPINDAQFGTLQHHAGRNAALTVAAVLLILWLALHSWRIILAAAISLVCGLAMSAALGLWLVGALNLMSVAFFVLFVGLGVDFGIQFSVRYRAERHETGALRPALASAARKAGGPLALAAAATAIGFSAFVPTSYRGLSELGEIAGCGMLIAFMTSVTLLPALLAVLNPPGEPRAMGFKALAPVDRFLQRHRIAVVTATFGVALLGAPLLYWLPFDFNPLHLQNPKAEAVATYLELRRDPQTGANAIELLKPDLAAAEAAAHRLAGLPEVAQTRTAADLVPADQDRKLAMIRQIAAILRPMLDPRRQKPPPTDQDNIAALRATSAELAQLGTTGDGPGAVAARRFGGLLGRLAGAEPAIRDRATDAFVRPLRIALDHLRAALEPQPVTLADLPAGLKRQWLTPSGEARVQVLPKADPENTAQLRQFVAAVLASEPDATGPAVTLYEAGNTILNAFVIAGAVALGGIFVLLWIALRRLTDVLVTLVPLLIAALVTLELCVILDLPLNFANIIALPLLLGVGVAFKIYYVMAWRRGLTGLVQSTLSRAVIFSAMTTATAFGSLWLSSDPGTSSMGQLMALALVCTMGAAVLFQPALMGPPRTRAVERAVEKVRMPAASAFAEPDAAEDWVVTPAGRPAARAGRVEHETEEEETVTDDYRR